MKKCIKKLLCAMLIVTVIFSCIPMTASALSGRATLIFSNNSIVVGDKVTVTAVYTTDESIDVLEGYINYDSTKLKFVSGADMVQDGDGKIKFVSTNAEGTYNSVSAEFEAIAAGTVYIKLDGCKAANTQEAELSPQGANLIISQATTSTPDEGASKNANLSSLTVSAGTLEPAFSPDVTEYRVTVPYDKTDGIMYCQTADGNAKISISGERELKVGITKRSVTVTAPSGDTKTYSITFNRLDENGNDTTASANENNPKAVIDGKNYYVSDNFENVTVPEGLVLTVFVYEGVQVSAYTDVQNSITVLYLMNEDSTEGAFYTYDKQSGFAPFRYINTAIKTYIILELPQTAVPTAYYATTYDINGITYPCYKYIDNSFSQYVVFYAKAPNGSDGYYRYHVDENTIQKFDDFSKTAAVSIPQETIPAARRNVIIVLMVLAAELFVAIIAIGVVMIVKSKKRKETEYDIMMTSDYPEDEE